MNIRATGRASSWLLMPMLALALATPQLVSAQRSGGDLRVLRHQAAAFARSDLQRRDLRFSAFGRSFAIALERNERIELSPAARHAGIEALRGTLQGAAAGSWVRITQTPAGPFGLIFDGRELYGIEPAGEVRRRLELRDARNPNADAAAKLAADNDDAMLAADAAPVIYRLADTRLVAGEQSCAVNALPGVRAPGRPTAADDVSITGQQAFDQLTRELQQTAALVAPTKQLSLGLVGDYEFSRLSLPNGLTPEATLAARMNIVDGIYSNQVGVRLNASISVFTAPDDPFSDAAVAGTLLDELANWRAATASQSSLGLTHLVTGRDLDGSTVGVGFIGSLCRMRSGTSLSQGTLSTVNAALVMAHELGHNFGAFHDGEAGRACETTPTTFLMAPSLNGSQTFSDCSLGSIRPVVDAAACAVAISAAADADFDLPIPPSRARGTSFDYSFDVRSIGGSAVENVAVRIVVPAGLTLNAASSAGTPCVLGGDNTAQCAVGSIAAGARRSLTINLTAAQTGTHALAVSLSASNDGTPGNNAAQMSFRVDPAADLAVTSSVAPARIQAGASTTLTATARLVSGDPVSDARLSFSISSLLTLSAVQPNAMGCTRNGAIVSCTPSPLAAGVPQSVVLTLTGARAGTGGVTVAISSASIVDAVASNNSAFSSIGVDASADLGVELTATPTRFRSGDSAVVTARVTHIAGDPVTDAALTLLLPAGMSVVSVEPNSLGCSAATGGALSCAPSSLSAGQNQSVVFTVRSAQSGTAALTANVRSATTSDAVAANDSATLSFTVDPAQEVVVGGGGGGGGGGGSLSLAALALLYALALLRWASASA